MFRNIKLSQFFNILRNYSFSLFLLKQLVFKIFWKIRKWYIIDALSILRKFWGKQHFFPKAKLLQEAILEHKLKIQKAYFLNINILLVLYCVYSLFHYLIGNSKLNSSKFVGKSKCVVLKEIKLYMRKTYLLYQALLSKIVSLSNLMIRMENSFADIWGDIQKKIPVNFPLPKISLC